MNSRLSHSTSSVPQDQADEELLQRALAGLDTAAGRAAASELLERYQGRIFGWCLRYTRDRERALDLAQDVLAKLWVSLPRFAHQSRFSWWVFVITRNRCLNALQEHSWSLPHDEIDPELPAGSPGADQLLDQLERAAILRRLMDEQLDPDERMALVLSHFEQLPVDEITRMLRLSNSSGARALLQRARRKLRAAAEREGLRDA